MSSIVAHILDAAAPVCYNGEHYPTFDPAHSPEMIKDIYEKRAQGYDTEDHRAEYHCPATLAAYMSHFVTNKEAKILDIGAGTGLLGTQLQGAGYSHVDAVDPSSAMLKEASKHGVYERTINDFLGPSHIDINDNTYDVLTGAGCFVPAHINTDAFPTLHRILKPGGYFFVVCNERYYGDRFERYGESIDKGIKDYIERGLWQHVSRDKIPYMGCYNAHVSVLRKTAL